MIKNVTVYGNADYAVIIREGMQAKPDGIDGLTDAAIDARKVCYGLIEMYCELTGTEYDSVGIENVEITQLNGEMKVKISGLIYKEDT